MSRWTLPFVAAFVTSGLGTAINFATNNVQVWWLWVAVIGLSIVAGAIMVPRREPSTPTADAQRGIHPTPDEPGQFYQHINLHGSGPTNIAGRDLTVYGDGNETRPL